MIDYKYGKVYTIRSYSRPDLIYVGSTCTPLFRRLAKHKSNFKCFNKGKGNYVTSFELLKCNDYYIELVEDFPCERKEQLNSREAHFIRTMNCINKVIPFLTDEEKKQYKAIYRQENKEEIKKKQAIFYEEKLFELNVDCAVIVSKKAVPLSFVELKNLILVAYSKVSRGDKDSIS